MANMVTEHLNSGWVPTPMGNEAQSGSPASGMYSTLTSPILLAANNNIQFFSLCDALNSIGSFDKEKWKSESVRRSKQSDLRKEFQSIFITKTAEDLEILLNNFNVPAGRVRSLPDAVSDKQFQERRLWNKINIKSINRDYFVPSIGFKVDEKPVLPESPPQILGGDTEQVLKEIGITRDLVNNLRKDGIIN